RLRDRLPMADRQCVVLVGAPGQCLVHEQVPRHGEDGIEHALVTDARRAWATLAQPLDQAIAHALPGHAHADGFRLQAQARGHAALFLLPGCGCESVPPSASTQLATCSSAW